MTDDLRLTRAIVQLLAEGAPVEPARIAKATGESLKTIQRTLLLDLPAHVDPEGRVVALSLSLEPTPHRVTIGGRVLYSWCVGQALMYPTLLGTPMRLESACRETGRPVLVEFDQIKVTKVEPGEAVVGSHALAVSAPSLQSCDDMRLFSSPEAARGWRGRHPEAAVLPVRDAYARYVPLLRGLLERSGGLDDARFNVALKRE